MQTPMLKEITATARRVTALPGDVSLWGAAFLTALLATNSARAASTGSTANVRGALVTNEEALAAVQDSALTTDGAQDAIQSGTNTVLYAAGLVGIVVAFIGLYMVFKHSKEGDRAQGSAMSGWVVVAVGGLITIVSIATAVVPNLLVGSAP